MSPDTFTLPSTTMSTTQLIKNETQRSKIFSRNSLSAFDVVQQPVKKSIKVLRKQNKDKKKIPPTTWRIIIISIIAALILSIIAVGIYLAIRFIRSTTKSTTIVANPVLRWNVTGITIAGIGGSAG
ncbi:unnamed protein product, partial [Adineta ricciae]